MFKIVTRNSTYTITPVNGGFKVERSADMWGRAVKNRHAHFTKSLRVENYLVTDKMVSSEIMAVVAV